MSALNATGTRRGLMALATLVLFSLCQSMLAAEAGAPLPLPKLDNVPEPIHADYGVEFHQPVTMSDGITLRGDIWYPADASGEPLPGPFPVLLQQTPYSKEVIPYGGSISVTDVRTLVGQGYIVAITDVRGTGRSEGTYEVMSARDAQDGVELVDWAASLPNATGTVGLFGHSFMAIHANATAAAIGPDSPVKAVFAMAPYHSLYRDLITQGGMANGLFDYTVALFAIGGVGAAAPLYGPIINGVLHGDLLNEDGRDQFHESLKDMISLQLQHLNTYPSFMVPLYADMNLGGDKLYDGEFWAERDLHHKLHNIVDNDIATFLVGSWNDVFQRGEPLLYTGLQNAAVGRDIYLPMEPGQTTDPRFQLLMGPWTHLSMDITQLTNLQVRWFNGHLKGEDHPMLHTDKPLHVYTQSPADYTLNWAPPVEDQWFDTDIWPLNGGDAVKYYLRDGRSGSTFLSRNDGKLSLAAPTGFFGTDTLYWMPLSSFCNKSLGQWQGGVANFASSLINKRFPCDLDDSTIQIGPGALTYTTEPFLENRLLAGPISASIFMRSTTFNTQLVATVEMIEPGTGRSIPLTSGSLLGSSRALDDDKTWTASNGEPLKPYHAMTRETDKPVPLAGRVRYDIEIYPTAVQIPAGYQLRLTLTSSSTPHLIPPAIKMPGLIGGIYAISRNRNGQSFINLPLHDPDQLPTRCPDSVCLPINQKPPFLAL